MAIKKCTWSFQGKPVGYFVTQQQHNEAYKKIFTAIAQNVQLKRLQKEKPINFLF